MLKDTLELPERRLRRSSSSSSTSGGGDEYVIGMGAHSLALLVTAYLAARLAVD